ncbi:hypothetical protein LRS05_16485 [Flavobacterium sp. J372]|uniref:hypothetical protein n=1 Tax=Flavobacterium sp. J372 TaxID=2898436 RepID=UPI002151F3A3|nr:hypothetical protein [Flavobacterium sp. J372]MCR5863601.1 hypothetical protein [Flavobacterium sp. J372]
MAAVLKTGSGCCGGSNPSKREVIPATMPLFVRLSAVDYSNSIDAWTMEESVRPSENLKELGVDFANEPGGVFVQG